MPDGLPFVVVGESLAAGAGDCGLRRELQRVSFAAQFARQIGAPFPLPLLEPPGLECVPPGFPQPPIRMPAPLQWGVRDDLPPQLVANVSVPGLTFSDALHLRPEPPVVRPHDVKATAVNVLVGLAALALGEEPLAPLDYAIALEPGMALVALGYSEALEAAAGGSLGDLAFLDACIGEILARLRERGVRALIATVPSPFDTAAFSTIAQASECLRIAPEVLAEAYALEPGDLLTAAGLMAIGSQFFGRGVAPLPAGAVRPSAAAAELASGLLALNRSIVRLAEHHDATVFDLASAVLRIRQQGAVAGERVVTADYLGGVYSLAGCYPGATGHALLANELIRCVNATAGARITEIDLRAVVAQDPVAAYRGASGPMWTAAGLPQPLPRRRGATRRQPPPPDPPSSAPAAITLPSNLECVLTLNPAGSYFGDAIAAVDIVDPGDVKLGTSTAWLFGGHAMVESHLHGRIRIRFEPASDGTARFELSFLDGLQGEDSVLVAPVLFEMPFQRNAVADAPGTISTGTVDLATGEVSGLTVYAQYASTALLTLVQVNPTFPRQPLAFPGTYGSAWARFESRADGTLDFTFAGSTFVPLGPGIRWPLPFAGPSAAYATVPASGTTMHPHLFLTTRPSGTAATAGDELPLPTNTVREYVLHTHNSAFGDAFRLTCPDLGGPAKGRSHVLGRLQVQFGAETAGRVPVALSMLGPAGVFATQTESPVTLAFPGHLSTGAMGFYELLRFPLRTYALDDLAVISDPFDPSVGLVDRATGRLVHPLLHRGFIQQDLIFALLRVEPRTPHASFAFRGPAVFERGAGGLVFRFDGQVGIPYPEGFAFPQPDLSGTYTIGSNSALEPFLWLQAAENTPIAEQAFEAAAENVISSTGDLFSYRVSVSPGAAPKLVYQNHSQQGTFVLRTLTWASVTHSRFARATPDTLTISGLGIWEKDGCRSIQSVAAQFCASGAAPYVGIQVGSAQVSNVNTRPSDEEAARP